MIEKISFNSNNEINANGDIKAERVTEVIKYLKFEISSLVENIKEAQKYNCIEAMKYFDGRKDAYEHMIAVLECSRVYNG